jgi:hypothetical protein
VRLELPGGLDGHRRRIRRGGYPSRKVALEVLGRLAVPLLPAVLGSCTTLLAYSVRR